jgi:hypothetical protein
MFYCDAPWLAATQHLRWYSHVSLRRSIFHLHTPGEGWPSFLDPSFILPSYSRVTLESRWTMKLTCLPTFFANSKPCLLDNVDDDDDAWADTEGKCRDEGFRVHLPASFASYVPLPGALPASQRLKDYVTAPRALAASANNDNNKNNRRAFAAGRFQQ